VIHEKNTKSLLDFFSDWFHMLFFIQVTKRALTDHMLGNNAQHTKAIIIDEKNYEPNQPVKAEFSYSYMFIANGKQYTGNSHNTKLSIGDTVEVEYVKSWPSLNRPLHPTD